MKQLIDKSAVIAEIEKNKNEMEPERDWHFDEYTNGYLDALKQILSFIDTIEVKEVDLNEEYIEEIYSHIDGIRDTADRMTSGNFMHHRAAIKFSANVIEQVLGLIGLKTQKGE